MGPVRPRPLHNFSLPYLKWGSQRFLRCMKDSYQGESSPSNLRSSRHRFMNTQPKSRIFNPPRPLRKSPALVSFEDGQVEFAREKLSSELQRMPIFEEAAEGPSSAKPWNLRNRRQGSGRTPSDEKKTDGSTSKDTENGGEKHDGTKFSISLSRDEVEADFAAMAGTRPPRRSKKRAKTVQKYLDSVFPGLWLAEVTPESYKVSEIPDPGKV